MMEELVNMIATDASAADISDQIKDILFAKPAERIDGLRPYASNDLFGNTEPEAEAEVETEVEAQPEEEEETDV